MASATATVKPTECSARIIRLEIEITGADGVDHRYGVSAIDPGCAGVKAFELVKHDARKPATYHVVRARSGLTICSCADYIYRHDGTSSTCKHGNSLISLGLLPAVEPTPDRCCPASEPEPCVACLAAPAEPPAVYADEAPELTPAEMHDPEDIDPADVESDPELWPADPRWDGWFVTPVEPTPEPEPAVVDGVHTYRRFQPTGADLAWESTGHLALESRRAPRTRTRTRWDKPC